MTEGLKEQKQIYVAWNHGWVNLNKNVVLCFSFMEKLSFKAKTVQWWMKLEMR